MSAAASPPRLGRAILPVPRGPAPVRRNRVAATAIWPLVIVAWACFIPRELSIDIATATMYPYRLALLLVAPLTIRELYRRPVGITAADYVAVFAAVWHWIALMVTATLRDALVTGFGQGIDLLLAYATGRAFIRSVDDLRRFAKALVVPTLIATLTLVMEVAAARPLIHPWIAQFSGFATESMGSTEFRKGILRATGPFPHPILGGALLGSLFPLFLLAIRDIRWKIAGVAAASGFLLSVSSTGYLAFIFGGIMIALLLLQEFTQIRVLRYAAFFTVLGSILAEVGNSTGVVGLLARFTLDPMSVYWRQLIWHFAGADALAHPFFGIGMRDWVRPVWMAGGSIDAHGLALAVRFGLPTAIAVGLLVLIAAYRAARRTSAMSRGDARAAYSVSFVLVAIFFASFMVALWDGPLYLPLMIAGMGVSLGSVRAIALPAPVVPPAVPVRAAATDQPGEPGRLTRQRMPFRPARR